MKARGPESLDTQHLGMVVHAYNSRASEAGIQGFLDYSSWLGIVTESVSSRFIDRPCHTCTHTCTHTGGEGREREGKKRERENIYTII